MTNKGGRPSKFSQELLDEICDRLSRGEPLAVICREEKFPTDRTVRTWIQERADVSSAIACAREVGYDQIAADALLIADKPVVGEKVEYNADGAVVKRQTGDTVDRARLMVDTRLKLLAKWDPKRYGERQQVEHSGSIATATDPEQVTSALVTMATQHPTLKPVIRKWLTDALAKIPE